MAANDITEAELENLDDITEIDSHYEYEYNPDDDVKFPKPRCCHEKMRFNRLRSVPRDSKPELREYKFKSFSSHGEKGHWYEKFHWYGKYKPWRTPNQIMVNIF